MNKKRKKIKLVYTETHIFHFSGRCSLQSLLLKIKIQILKELKQQAS